MLKQYMMHTSGNKFSAFSAAITLYTHDMHKKVPRDILPELEASSHGFVLKGVTSDMFLSVTNVVLEFVRTSVLCFLKAD